MRIFSKLLPASKLKLVISSIGVMALIAFSTVVLFEITKVEVVFAENGDEQTIKTHANTVEELLKEMGITVGKYDALSHSMDESIKDGMTIGYESAKKVDVVIDGKKQEYYTVSETIGEFLNENNLSFSDRDHVSHKVDEKITDGLQIDVAKAFQVVINDGGKKQKVWTTGGSVKQLLTANDITYNSKSNDKINHKLTDPVKKGTKIRITRVDITNVDESEPIKFATETKEDPSLEKGKKRVLSEGEEGVLVKTYKVIKENGSEVNKELLNEKVTKESKNRVVAIGTKEQAKPAVTTVANKKSNSSTSGGKELYVTASAFTATCNGCSGYTATGINLKANPNMKVIAVDPSVIPLGSKVWVEGYGIAIAGDTGGSINGQRIDVHVPSKAAAQRWGIRKVKVKILN